MTEEIPQSIKKLIQLSEEVKNGNLKLKAEQEEKLNSLLEGYRKSEEADLYLKKIMTAVLYERLVYIGKLGVLEKIGLHNEWRHPLLAQMKDILYEESDLFELEDRNVNDH